MSKIVKQGQSFLDKTIQLTGGIEAAVAKAILNDKSITDELAIGEEVTPSAVINKRVVAHFVTIDEPATDITGDEITDVKDGGTDIELDGIGYMIIEDTFIVR